MNVIWELSLLRVCGRRGGSIQCTGEESVWHLEQPRGHGWEVKKDSGDELGNNEINYGLQFNAIN